MTASRQFNQQSNQWSMKNLHLKFGTAIFVTNISSTKMQFLSESHLSDGILQNVYTRRLWIWNPPWGDKSSKIETINIIHKRLGKHLLNNLQYNPGHVVALSYSKHISFCPAAFEWCLFKNNQKELMLDASDRISNLQAELTKFVRYCEICNINHECVTIKKMKTTCKNLSFALLAQLSSLYNLHNKNLI